MCIYHYESESNVTCEHTPGAVGGSVSCSRVVVLRVEESAGHSPPPQFLPARDSNPRPLCYESDSLTIRPRLPPYGLFCPFISAPYIIEFPNQIL